MNQELSKDKNQTNAFENVKPVDDIEVVCPSELPSEEMLYMMLQNPQEMFLQLDVDAIFKD